MLSFLFSFHMRQQDTWKFEKKEENCINIESIRKEEKKDWNSICVCVVIGESNSILFFYNPHVVDENKMTYHP